MRPTLTATSDQQKNPPFQGASATPQPLTVKDDRSVATLAHFGGVVGCLPSAVIYATLRQRGRFTAQESREALNFTLVPSAAILLCMALSLVGVIGWFFGLLAALIWLYLAVVSLIAGIRVNRGNPYQYRYNFHPLDVLASRKAAKENQE